MRTYLIAFALALLASLVLTRLVRDLALRFGFVDEAVGGRKVHTTPVPRVGGIAIALAMAVPLAGLLFWDNKLSRAFFADTSLLISLFGGGGLILALGIYDDFKGAKAPLKLAVQGSAAAAVWFSGIHIDVLSVPVLGAVELGWLAPFVTMFWIVLITNAVNLIDGLDGLAGSVVALAAGTLFVFCVVNDDGLAALLLATVVGGVLGFLVYNRSPASIFLGDTGSLFLGFILALISLHSTQKSAAVFSFVTAALVLALPLFDLSMAVVRRYLMGQPIMVADQHHVHHRLLSLGLSKNKSLVLLAGAALTLDALAVSLIYTSDALTAVISLALVPVVAVAVYLLGYDRVIRKARRAMVMAKVTDAAEERAQMVHAFVDAAQQTRSLRELESKLTELGTALGFDRIAVDVGGTLDPPRRPWRFVWERTVQAGRDDVHLQEKVRRSYPMRIGRRAFGTITLERMSEREVFAPHDDAMHHLVAYDLAGAWFDLAISQRAQDRAQEEARTSSEIA